MPILLRERELLTVMQAGGVETVFEFSPVGDNGVETIAVNLDNILGLTLNLGTSGGIAFVGCTASPPAVTDTPTPTATPTPTRIAPAATVTQTQEIPTPLIPTVTPTSTPSSTPETSTSTPTETPTETPDPLDDPCAVQGVSITSESVTRSADGCFESPNMYFFMSEENERMQSQFTGWTITANAVTTTQSYDKGRDMHRLCVVTAPVGICSMAVGDVRLDSAGIARVDEPSNMLIPPTYELWIPFMPNSR